MRELPEPATGSPLLRGIRRWDLLAIMINATIGAGIFGLPSRVYALIGAYSLFAYVACGVVVALIVLCFAEVGSRFDGTGGPYLYARVAFGPFAGFEVGWLTWLARLTSFAALCNLLVSYLHALWPAASSEPWRSVVICVVVGALTAVNVAGVRDAAVTSNAFSIGKLLPLGLLIAVGLPLVVPSRLVPGPPPAAGAFSKTVLLLVFAFSGFDVVGVVAGEMRDPRRDLPWAMLAGIAAVTLIYELLQVVCVGTLPGLAGSERPLADAGVRVLGGAGAVVLSLGALISILGTLNGIVLAAPRLLFAMAEHHELPRVLAAAHPRFRTPWVAILVSSGIMLVLAVTGSFIRALTISTIIRMLTYVATCAALIALRRRPDSPPAVLLVPAGAALATLSLAVCGWLIANSGLSEMRDAGMVALLGVAVYVARRPFRHQRQ